MKISENRSNKMHNFISISHFITFLSEKISKIGTFVLFFWFLDPSRDCRVMNSKFLGCLFESMVHCKLSDFLFKLVETFFSPLFVYGNNCELLFCSTSSCLSPEFSTRFLFILLITAPCYGLTLCFTLKRGAGLPGALQQFFMLKHQVTIHFWGTLL